MKPILASLTAAAIVGIGAVLAGGTASAAEQRFVSIGTGGVTGVYYPAGGAICRLVNKNRKEHGIRCSVESTAGSIYNLNALRQGELEFGIVQSDWEYHSAEGSSQFKEQGPDKKLRSVFALHPEPFTVLARTDAGIKSFDDLKGKRVNIGNPGSGQRGTMDVVLEAIGWKVGDFALASELKSSEQAQALCDNKVDAIVFTVGHPSGSIQEATTACDSTLISVEGAAIDKLVSDNPYYRKATIPGGMYRGTDKEIATFGVGAILVTSADVPNEVVYEAVKSIFENFNDFKQLHPALGNLDPKTMVTEGLSSPLHDGAVKYYKEKGWL